jgi:hypothetical protein
MGIYDSGKRRFGRRTGRERGVWIYIPAVELETMGLDPKGPTPYYRVWTAPGRTRCVVALYREP